MNRMEFMKILEAGLSGIPEAEKKEALQYYEDYLNDAGVESEQEVMEALGAPEQVAASIKAGLAGEGKVEFTEQGYRDGTAPEAPVSVRGSEAYGQSAQEGPPSGVETEKKDGNKLGRIILIVIACLLLSPVILPVGAAALGIVMGLAGGILGLWLSLFGVGIGAFFGGLVMAVGGVIELFSSAVAGALLLGIGLLLTGIGLLITSVTVWLTYKLAPALFRGCVSLCKRIFSGKGTRKA